jgi:hypothetical protein
MLEKQQQQKRLNNFRSAFLGSGYIICNNHVSDFTCSNEYFSLLLLASHMIYSTNGSDRKQTKMMKKASNVIITQRESRNTK